MNNTIAIESLAMDLKRVALGLHRGSPDMVHRFADESLKRIQEIDANGLAPYVRSILKRLPALLREQRDEAGRAAEDALMYSIQLQNYARLLRR